ncbi:polyhydroxyalkanoic acid system family protein [Rhodoblastus sp.]|uniref:polyhydroxyalkanoic acid system family protein n=1 Tax=Rhodoblastus sp. TaxID=1962975 RepID=UPI002611435D|nr:polyhydroxyalkanoic acid system family protein [Rhodoblastus sp.]
MGQIVTVDVKHSLGPEEAKRRVQAGIEAMKAKYGEQLSFAEVQFNDMHADVVITALGHSLKGAFDFLPDCVRVSLELPWVLALVAERAKGLIAHKTETMLLPPPPKG